MLPVVSEATVENSGDTVVERQQITKYLERLYEEQPALYRQLARMWCYLRDDANAGDEEVEALGPSGWFMHGALTVFMLLSRQEDANELEQAYGNSQD